MVTRSIKEFAKMYDEKFIDKNTILIIHKYCGKRCSLQRQKKLILYMVNIRALAFCILY